jgi:hypothetical protein
VEDGEAVAGVKREGLVLRDPVQIEAVVNGGHTAEFADVVAKEVNARNPEGADLGNGGG